MKSLLEIVMIWFAAGATISVFSYLFKPLPSFDFYESVTIGGAIANVWLVTIPRIARYNNQFLGGNTLMIIPIILGALMFAVLTKNYKWVTYYPSSVLMGLGFGAVLAEMFRMIIVGNIAGIIDRFSLATSGWELFNAAVILVAWITSSAYFFYTVEQKGTMRYVTRIGRLFMMAALGAAWASYLLDKTESVIALLYGVLWDTWQAFL